MSHPATFESITLHQHLPEELTVQAFWVRGRFPTRCEASPLVGDNAPNAPPSPPVDESVKSAVRALLRWGGHKPSGRGRPASESLAKAVEDGRWPSISPLVDCCNALSLQSGLPISVLDAGKLQAPLEIRIGQPEEEYVFNPSGQVLSLKGLLLLADASGPTGGPVKDAQRSKVDPSTDSYLIIVWGSSATPAANDSVRDGLKAWCQTRASEFQTLELLPRA